jgi:hypothetical protein
MLIPRRATLMAGRTLAAPGIARAQACPGERPPQIIVSFPPGGSTDVNVRAMAPHVEYHLPGALFVVMNRPGAGARDRLYRNGAGRSQRLHGRHRHHAEPADHPDRAPAALHAQ